MTDQHIIALRAALIRSETENMELRQQLLDKEAEIEATKALLIASTEPRQELIWPAGCLSVHTCGELKQCSGGCATHSGRPIAKAVETFADAAWRQGFAAASYLPTCARLW